jgi:hypothetical protein
LYVSIRNKIALGEEINFVKKKIAQKHMLFVCVGRRIYIIKNKALAIFIYTFLFFEKKNIYRTYVLVLADFYVKFAFMNYKYMYKTTSKGLSRLLAKCL